MKVTDMQSGGAYLINRRWAIRAGGPTPATCPEMAAKNGCSVNDEGQTTTKADGLMPVGAFIRYDLLGKVGVAYSATMWLKDGDEVLPISEGTFSEIQKEVREHDTRLTQLRFKVIDASVGAVLLNQTT